MTDVLTDPARTPTIGARIRSTDPIFLEILELLTDEATLLDHDQYLEWIETLTEDIHYWMPLRETRYRFDGRGFSDGGSYCDDDLAALTMKAKRNAEFKYAYDRDPPPRIRRVVSNLTLFEGGKSDEFVAKSYILALKNRFDNPTYDILTAERVDVIRRTPKGLKLARRAIYVDMQVLSTFTWANVIL